MREHIGYVLFIAALGDAVSDVAGAIVSVAAVDVLDPAAMPASEDVGAVAALSAVELGIAPLLLMSPCGVVLSLGAAVVLSPIVDWVVVDEVSGCIVDWALTAPGIIRAAAARKSTLRMRLAPLLWSVSDHKTFGSSSALPLMR